MPKANKNADRSRGNRARGLREKIGRTAGGADVIRETLNAFDNIRVLPLKPTVLKYLFGYTGIPYGRAFTLVGPPGCSKSVMAHYFSAVICDHVMEGMCGFIDAEKKTNPDQVKALYKKYAPSLETEQDMVDARIVYRPHFQEDQFMDMTRFGKHMLDFFEEGDRFPWCVTVDSINYLMSEDFAKKVAKGELTPGYVHMHKANALRSFLGVWLPTFLNDYPANLIAVNHQQEKTEDKGHMTVTKKSESGGVFKDFAWSYNFEMDKGTWAKHTQTVKKQGFTMRSKKSTSSENGRKIGVVMETGQELGDDGSFVGLDINLNFDAALAELMCGTPKWDKNNSATSAAFRDDIGLSVTGAKYTCTAVNVKDVSATECGRAIEEEIATNQEFRNKVYQELGIMSKPELDFSAWEAPSDSKMLKQQLADYMLTLDAARKQEVPTSESAPRERSRE